MEASHFYRRCKDLAGNDSTLDWTRDHLFGFFQAFRPDGGRLESLFADIPSGTAVYRRLQQVFAATAAGWQREGSHDPYFVVRAPQPASSDALLASAGDQLASWRSMAVAVGEQELVDLLTPLPSVTLRIGMPPPVDPNDTESLGAFIHDVQSDWHGSLEPLCPHASWMREAFYSIACDYRLANYVTWPWYVHSTSLIDPLKPWFTLWRHGAELRCNSADDVSLFVRSA